MKEQMQLRKAVFEAKKSFESIKVNAEYKLGSTVIKYADIQQIMSKIAPSLLANNIDTVTTVKRVEGHEVEADRDVITRLIHVDSGESEEYIFPCKLRNPEKTSDQAAAHTTGRRYNLIGAFGLTIEKDGGIDEEGYIIPDEETSTTEEDILNGIKAEDVQLLAELTAELNSAATKDELLSIWKKKNKQVKELGNFMQNVLGIAKDKLKEDLKDAA
tara:strand:+ start:2838 stop:3485 length:648 start_codon:yes stop_codon:yes gene_type:complete